MTETLTADAVVVGSGVIGSAVALELARGGRSVLVLDKAAGPGHGSTSASSAVIRFMYSTFESVATAWESKFCWEQWADHLGVAGLPAPEQPDLSRFHRTGMLHLDVPAVPREHRGKYLAFTHASSAGMRQLKALATQGKVTPETLVGRQVIAAVNLGERRIAHLVAEGATSGAIDAEEREMIEGVIAFGDTQVLCTASVTEGVPRGKASGRRNGAATPVTETSWPRDESTPSL